jgi:hypothetical protein
MKTSHGFTAGSSRRPAPERRSDVQVQASLTRRGRPRRSDGLLGVLVSLYLIFRHVNEWLRRRKSA